MSERETAYKGGARVYCAINAIQGELASTGIAKGRKNQQQGYSFRGIDDIYGALAPLLSKYGLVILPRVVSRSCIERVNQKGTALFYVTVEAEFDIVSSDDGTSHVVRAFGEAMDSGDKATNKAMSAAYKYMALMTFCIPTEGDNDSENQTHEVESDSTGMDPDALAAAVKAIKAAPLNKLRAVWDKACKDAGGDQSAIKKMTDAANDRKRELMAQKGE